MMGLNAQYIYWGKHQRRLRDVRLQCQPEVREGKRRAGVSEPDSACKSPRLERRRATNSVLTF